MCLCGVGFQFDRVVESVHVHLVNRVAQFRKRRGGRISFGSEGRIRSVGQRDGAQTRGQLVDWREAPVVGHDLDNVRSLVGVDRQKPVDQSQQSLTVLWRDLVRHLAPRYLEIQVKFVIFKDGSE